MRIAGADRSKSGVLNITPMIDMAFLLITFFIMTIRLGLAREQNLELPRADQAQMAHESRVTILTVDIDRAGRLSWEGRAGGLGELERRLEKSATSGADLKVVLRADARAPFAMVERVMRSAALAGVTRLSVAALKLGEKRP